MLCIGFGRVVTSLDNRITSFVSIHYHFIYQHFLIAQRVNLYYIEPGYNNAINYDFAAAGFTGNTYNTVNYKATVGLDSNSIGIELATAPSPDPVFVGGTVFPDRFKLVSGSTAYNIGNPAASYSVSGLVDYIFNDRIMGCRIDAGALEFVTTCTAGPVVTALNALRITTVLGKDTYSLYPNPTTGDVSIRAVRSTGGMVLIRVRDMLGRLVMEKRSPLAEGINTIRIDNLKQAGLRKGIYLVDISDKTGRVGIYKLVVQ
ncbi:MAG: T9SS type A sorting domain-containing protein [Sediminibacterium magnilacihabitans]|jgi:Secretion system C-terminal sorting domain|nr:T9SS type A sorting domain-containing protein [Sediminibacterium magnilacihabitans]